MKLRFFLVIGLATAFLSCTKYETWESEIKIVSTSVSEIGYTTAKLTIELSGSPWIAENIGFQISGYTYGITVLWNDAFDRGRYGEYFQHCEIGGLRPGITYRLRPYIEKGDIIVYGEFIDFTTEM